MNVMTAKKILVIVPASNESGNIRTTISELRSLPRPLDIIVIDDGSVDKTAALAREAGAAVISLPFNLGIGGAVQTGFLFARKKDYAFAVQVDGDGQHDVRYLDAILKPVMDDCVDIAVGSRFIPPFLGYQSSAIRRIGIHFFARLISFLTRYKVADPTSGFRAFNRRAIAAFASDYPPDFPEPESIVAAKRLGFRLCEVPVKMRKRGSGRSSIRYLMTLYYMIKVTFAILLGMMKKRKAVA
jgi:glycosyltransferase involved in cell wall biosynthesis